MAGGIQGGPSSFTTMVAVPFPGFRNNCPAVEKSHSWGGTAGSEPKIVRLPGFCYASVLDLSLVKRARHLGAQLVSELLLGSLKRRTTGEHVPI